MNDERTLSASEVDALLAEIPGWNLQGDSIVREYKLKDFSQAIHFVNHVAVLAQRENHHPDILILYNRVRLSLSTRSLGCLTRLDFRMAGDIDQETKELGLAYG